MRPRWTLGTIALTVALLLPSAAAADTATIGSASPTNFPPDSGCGGCHTLQFGTDPSSPSYVVPAAPPGGPWSITSWSARGGTDDGTASLEVWRPTGTPNEFSLAAIGPEQPFPPNTVTSHEVSIPVLPGDHLGVLSLVGEFSTSYDSPPGADVSFSVLGNPGVGQTTGAPTSQFGHFADDHLRINAAATLTAPSVPAKHTGKKCKKRKKHKRSAESAKKKKGKKKGK